MKKLTLAILAVAFTLNSFSQDEPNYGENKDECLKYISLYSGYLQQKVYKDAYRFWKEAVRVCPQYKPVLYSNGVYILKQLSKDETIPEPRRKALKDSISIVYEAGIAIFGATPDIMEDYGNDLILYDRNYEKAVKNINEAIDGLREKTKYSTLIYYTQALAMLENASTIDCERLIKEYERLSQFTEMNKGKKGYDKAQEAIDKYLGPCLTCDKLVPLIHKKMKTIKTDDEQLKKNYELLKSRGCTANHTFKEIAKHYAEKFPSVGGFEGLALVYLDDKEINKAIEYYEKAIALSTDKTEKAALLENAVSLAASKGSLSKANSLSNQLLDLDPNNGEAYLIKAQIAANNTCGNNVFEQQTKYWVAYDLAAKAKSIDSKVADKATRLMNSYAARFPEKGELFARSVEPGSSYTTCFGTSTIARGK